MATRPRRGRFPIGESTAEVITTTWPSRATARTRGASLRIMNALMLWTTPSFLSLTNDKRTSKDLLLLQSNTRLNKLYTKLYPFPQLLGPCHLPTTWVKAVLTKDNTLGQSSFKSLLLSHPGVVPPTDTKNSKKNGLLWFCLSSSILRRWH